MGLAVLKFLAILLRLFPHKAILYVVGAIGWLIGAVFPIRRKTLYENLKTAFGDEMNGVRRRKLVRATHAHWFMMLVEFLCISKNKDRIGEIVVEIEGEENLRKCLEIQGGAIVGLTGHIGNWEYTVPFTVHKLGLPMTAIAKPLHNKAMNEFINGIRRDAGADVLSSREGSKGIMGVLRRKGVMAIVADQDAGRRGEFLNFFNTPASTYVGPALFAWRMGVPLMPTFMIRIKLDKYKMIFFEAIAQPEGEIDKDKIISAMMQTYNDRLEETIRKYPEQYFWFHRRWKSKPGETKTKSNRKVKN